jgi:hypothetical protein
MVLYNKLMPTHPGRNRHLNALPPRLFARRAIITKDVVHLFERLASRFGHEEVHPKQRQKAEHGEEDVSAEAGALNQGRGDEADDEVEEPVARSGKSDRVSVGCLRGKQCLNRLTQHP